MGNYIAEKDISVVSTLSTKLKPLTMKIPTCSEIIHIQSVELFILDVVSLRCYEMFNFTSYLVKLCECDTESECSLQGRDVH